MFSLNVSYLSIACIFASFIDIIVVVLFSRMMNLKMLQRTMSDEVGSYIFNMPAAKSEVPRISDC